MILRLITCILTILICLLSMYIYGNTIVKLIKINCDVPMTICIGVFAFFSEFSLIALPCILLYKPFNLLFAVWNIVWIFTIIVCGVYLKIVGELYIKISLLRLNKWLFLILILLFFFQLYYVVTSNYVGDDGLFYMRVVAKAAEGNSMYLNCGLTGDVLYPHYALGTYYMFIAFLERMTGLTSVMTCKIIAGGLCYIISSLIVFSIGEFFFKEKENAIVLLILWMISNFMFVSIYTPANFLMMRAYEAKSWCGNVIYPMLMLVFFIIMDNEENRRWWLIAWLIAFSADFISMSATMGLPAFFTIGSGLVYLKYRKLYVIYNWIICCIPLVVVLFLIFFVEARGFSLGIF